MSVTKWFSVAQRHYQTHFSCCYFAKRILRTTAFIAHFDSAHVVLLQCWLTDYKLCWCAQCFLPNYWGTDKTSRMWHRRQMERERWGSRKKERKSRREGNSVKDGDEMRDDFALLCVILCLLKIFSYLTCALLYSPLHQVQPLLPSDS